MGCAAADEGDDKIYSVGGFRGGSSLSEAYQYKVSTNTWSSMRSLVLSSLGIGCAITRRAITGTRILIVTGNGRSQIQYLDLESVTSSWLTTKNTEVYSWNRPKVVAVTPWEIYKTAGDCASPCPDG